MRLLYPKANWEVYHLPLEAFLADVLTERYDLTEIYLAGRTESIDRIRDLHAQAGLRLIAQVVPKGANMAEYLASFEREVGRAVEAGALAINSQTGRDTFPHRDNLRVFECALELESRHKVPIWHETHRGRALCNGPATAALLRDLPTIGITADFAHWFCAHESDMSDQEDTLEAVIGATRHIHARVGFAEGPQVSDPRNPAFADWLARHIDLWTRIVRRRAAEGLASFTVTPEFGPPPYLPLVGIENRPVADPWEINRWMRGYLAPLMERAVG